MVGWRVARPRRRGLEQNCEPQAQIHLSKEGAGSASNRSFSLYIPIQSVLLGSSFTKSTTTGAPNSKQFAVDITFPVTTIGVPTAANTTNNHFMANTFIQQSFFRPYEGE
mmetsp:Transcript_2688/g.3826  ORF Transcript_2688/g.3826 Transcript_2688/m.3826 type:complete len:110 (-) Transcript_2688:67-396(-)